MKLLLRLNCDNAAFDEPATEIGRILRNAAERIEGGELGPLSLRDLNGNSVGVVTITGRAARLGTVGR